MEKVSKLHQKFGQRVQKLRQGKGISQEELAFKIGVDHSYMGFVERGERNPTLEKITKIADVLGIPLSKLFSKV